VPHTADLWIEAWSLSREGRIGEAVLGTVESFLDTSGARAQRIRRCRLTADRDDDLLLAVLEEVIYRLDTAGEAPVDVELQAIPGGVDVKFPMVDASTQPQVGAVPKAVSLNERRIPVSYTPGYGCGPSDLPQPSGLARERAARPCHSTSGSPESRRTASRAARCNATAAAQSVPIGWIG